MTDSQRFAGRIALVTGASRGIGRAAAEALAREGAHVIALARTQGALEELDDTISRAGGAATLVPLDLTDGEGIDRLGAAVHERWQRLDILIGNAGILGELTPVSHIRPHDWQRLLDVNLTANWRLIRSFDPLLRQSQAGRAIFVSSGAARMNRPFWGGYGMTKAALEYLVKTYAAELEGSNATANLLDPGATATAMRAKAMPGEDPDTLPQPTDVAGLIVTMANAAFTENGSVVAYRQWAEENPAATSL